MKIAIQHQNYQKKIAASPGNDRRHDIEKIDISEKG